jgi:hypothetical protein
MQVEQDHKFLLVCSTTSKVADLCLVPPLLNQLGRKRCMVWGLLTTTSCLFLSAAVSRSSHHQVGSKPKLPLFYELTSFL